MVHSWSLFPQECEFIARDSHSDRVDRSLPHSWSPSFLRDMHESELLVDAHVLLPSHTPQNFQKLLVVLNEYLGEKQIMEILDYSSKFFGSLLA